MDLLRDVGTAHVEEVLCGQSYTVDVGDDLYLGHGVDVDVDEVVGGYAAACLDVGCHLTEEHFVQAFEQGNAQTTFTYVYTWLAVETGDDVGHRRRGFDVGDQYDKQYDDCHDDEGEDKTAHDDVI